MSYSLVNYVFAIRICFDYKYRIVDSYNILFYNGKVENILSKEDEEKWKKRKTICTLKRKKTEENPIKA